MLQGTLDLIVLSTLQKVRRQDALAIAARLQQASPATLPFQQSTLYSALVRLEQQGRIKGTWGKTEANRETKFYAITTDGEKVLTEEIHRWKLYSGVIANLLSD
ncbi:MAG TPA: helix-turn-helix transcriptional regulator [Bryobacteraceae bacterium]|nr:helix-turn-helix transcriptional regulator [Bryobacteraceae bacterium]